MDSLMDKGAILIIGKLLLTFAVVLGIPLWELYALRRDRESGDLPTPTARTKREAALPAEKKNRI